MGSEQTRLDPGGGTIEELFHALESPLLAYALRLVPDREAAEDIVQEAFMKLHARFNEVKEPRRWLYRTTHNLALNHRRDNARTIPLEPRNPDEDAPLDPADPLPLPDEQISRMESIGLVRLSMNSLEERDRELLRMKFHENLSYREISERTGLTTGNVGYLLHHAIKTVADELVRNGVDR